nr:IS1634 family transposase [uncultured Olsenella sp.]
MYLHKSKRPSGRVYLALAESYRKDGKSRMRTLRSLGYLDELEKETPDPVARWEAYCAEQNALAREGRQSVPIEIHPAQKIDERGGRRNIGCAVLLREYASMGIERVLRNATRGGGHGFDLNAVLRLLAVERVLDPGSKISAWRHREGYFFRCDFAEHDVYRALTLLAPLRDRVVSAVNRHVDSLGLRDTAKVYYGVTNYYFEIDDPDDLRRNGVSKERRRSPIVQMGPLQDRSGVPITYRLFPGNTNDRETMADVLAGLKRDYGLDRVVCVADKGNNTSANIAACVARGDGFVYSQSIRGTKSRRGLRRWVLDDGGYEGNADGTFRVKSRQDFKTVTVEGADGRRRRVDVEVKVVAFWSRKYAERARHERAETVARVRQLAASPGAYTAATHWGAAKYVDGIKVDGRTGEVVEAADVLVFNEARLAAEEECDGYYCIVTSEASMRDAEIIDAYRGLWRIEESFRVTKSTLETRPVYVSRRDHIEAHFLICYVALCILRIVQVRNGGRFSPQQIADELSKMSGMRLEGNWWVFDHRSDVTDALCETAGIDLTRRYMQLKDVRKILAEVRRG